MTKVELIKEIERLEDFITRGKNTFLVRSANIRIKNLKFQLHHPILFKLNKKHWNIRKRVAQFIYPFEEE